MSDRSGSSSSPGKVEGRGRSILVRVGILAASALIPAAISWSLAEAPRERTIHIESFRYGKEPSVIRCNRGDILRITFSTRDTAHSFFLEEYDVDAKISPGSDEVEVFRATRPEESLGPGRREVVIRAGQPGLLGALASKSSYRCHVWCGPMHAFEQGILIVEPNLLLWAALGLVIGIPAAGLVGIRRVLRGAAPPPPEPKGIDLLRGRPRLRSLVRSRWLQFTCIIAALVLLYAVLLTTLFGTRVAGRNLGSMLLWIVWLFALTVVLVPIGGRIWCYACPLPVLGEWLQRGAVLGVRTGSTAGTKNRFFGLSLAPPAWLRTAWPRTLAFLALGTFSTALVSQPRATGWVLLGIVVVSTATALIYRGRTFCVSLCPVNAFIGLYATAGKLGVGSADPTTCASCRPVACERGSGAGWACPYGLRIGNFSGNIDCGLCGECLRTCPYGTATLLWRPFVPETRLASLGESWQAMVMSVLAIAYCLVHLGPWPAIRDWVNILDKGNWGLFAGFAAILWTAAFAILPGIVLLLGMAGRSLAGSSVPGTILLRASSAALVPIGLALWGAFVVPMLFVHISFIGQSLGDPFGWGWRIIDTSRLPWRQLIPGAIPWIQSALVLGGLAFGLRSAWRAWLGMVPEPRAALRGAIPYGLFLVALMGSLAWFFAG